MNRKLFVLALLGSVMLYASSAFASYIDQITDQSAEWIGNPTRLASTDSVDCVTYNPAGTVKMADGLHVHFSSQSIDNNNTTEVTGAGYPSAMKYETHKPSKFVPSFYANYKNDNWSAYTGVHIIGGGGSTFWENGTPNLNLAVQAVEQTDIDPVTAGVQLHPAPWSNSKFYFADDGSANAGISVDMLSMFPALTIGGAYKLNDMLTMSLGARVIKATQTIKITASESGLGGSKDTLYDAEWNATGYMGIIGLNIQPTSELNIGITYESMSKMDWKVSVHDDLSYKSTAYNNEHVLSSASGYTDGRKFRFDIPARLMLGIEYVITPTLKADLAGMIYMSNWGTYEKPTKSTATNPLAGTTYKQNVNSYDFDIAWEAGAGFSWEFLKNITWTGGVNYDCMNVKDQYLSELMNKIDLWNVGTGLKIRTEENLNLMVSYMHNFYITRSNNSATDGTNYYKTEYSKTANVFAFSIEYKFL